MNEKEMMEEISKANILDVSYGILMAIQESKDVSAELIKIEHILLPHQELEELWENQINFLLSWAENCDDLDMIKKAISMTNPGMIKFRISDILSKKQGG